MKKEEQDIFQGQQENLRITKESSGIIIETESQVFSSSQWRKIFLLKT
jgi:hypothetical protein